MVNIKEIMETLERGCKDPIIENLYHDEPIIEELEDQYLESCSLVLESNEFLYLCTNKKCFQSPYKERIKCPCCGEDITKINKLKINEI